METKSVKDACALRFHFCFRIIFMFIEKQKIMFYLACRRAQFLKHYSVFTSAHAGALNLSFFFSLVLPLVPPASVESIAKHSEA